MSFLWVEGDFVVLKVICLENRADLLTHHCTEAELQTQMCVEFDFGTVSHEMLQGRMEYVWLNSRKVCTGPTMTNYKECIEVLTRWEQYHSELIKLEGEELFELTKSALKCMVPTVCDERYHSKIDEDMDVDCV